MRFLIFCFIFFILPNIQLINDQLKRLGRELEKINLGSISPTFFKQLLSAQIPKAQKDIDYLTVFALLGSLLAKTARKTLMKLTHEIDTRSYSLRRGLNQRPLIESLHQPLLLSSRYQSNFKKSYKAVIVSITSLKNI